MGLLVMVTSSTMWLAEKSDIEWRLVVRPLVVVARENNRALGIEN